HFGTPGGRALMASVALSSRPGSPAGAPAVARRMPRVDGRLALGVLLVAGSVLGGLRLVAAADRTVAVVAAARDLPADHVIGPGDLTVTRVRATPSVLAGLVAGADVRHLHGRVLMAALNRHGL